MNSSYKLHTYTTTHPHCYTCLLETHTPLYTYRCVRVKCPKVWGPKSYVTPAGGICLGDLSHWGRVVMFLEGDHTVPCT